MSQYEDVELDPPLVNEISAAVPKEAKYYQQIKKFLRENSDTDDFIISKLEEDPLEKKIKFSSGVDMEKRRELIKYLRPSEKVGEARPLDLSRILEGFTESEWKYFIVNSVQQMKQEVKGYPSEEMPATNNVCCSCRF